MKINDIIPQYFSSINEKQWKNNINYELKGENYAEKLIQRHQDDIQSLPFYTKNSRKEHIVSPFQIKHIKSASISASKSTEDTLQKALTLVTEGYTHLFFDIYSQYIDSSQINNQLKVNCYFRYFFIPSVSTDKNIWFSIDPIGKLFSTGNWYKNNTEDWTFFKKNTPNLLTIDSSLFHNAGASHVQQVAYAIATLQEYATQIDLSHIHIVQYITAVNTDICLEIAKIKSLRQLHYKYFNDKVKMEIISKKSYINQHIVCHELNHDITATELLIAKNSCVDYIDKSLIDVNDNTSFFANNFYIENLERQISQKATLLINSIEQGGGIVVQYQKGILQQKIKTHKQESQQKFNKLFRKNMLNKSIDYEYINQLLQEENKPIKKTRYSKIYPIRIARALELLLVKSIDNL